VNTTFALALSWLIEGDGWHPSTGDMNRVRRLAWQYRNRLNPQDQAFLSLRLGSRYPRQMPWSDQIADAERAAQLMPESAEAWYYLGDALFHGGRLSDIPDPEVRARKAFEQAFQRDSLYGGPILHLTRLAFVMSDTAAQALWTRRQIALDSIGEGVPSAQWDLLQSKRDSQGIEAFLANLGTQSLGVPQGILFFNPLDSVTVAHQVELLDAVHQLSATKADRVDMAFTRWYVLLNRGRPAEAARWLDTLRTLNPVSAAIQSVLGATWYGAEAPDTSILAGNKDAASLQRFVDGDLSTITPLMASYREKAAQDTLQGFWFRWAPTFDAWVAVKRGDPAAQRLLDVADSLWVGRPANNTWASILLAQLYQSQGRIDRALRAVRRRYSPLGEPEAAGLAESFRLEGQLAALAGDKPSAIRAYRNYLRMRTDPEPSRIPQRDSVRAALAAVGDLERPR
jgi:tetratricopeptide (TPR) repeat protein